ncbi:MAG TPA: sulfate ABC transporter permease subunit CysT [Blastocatellia bacterium]|nr:sulfate ABC transporter permease subunit CysT [Blastocatellia bacterium]
MNATYAQTQGSTPVAAARPWGRWSLRAVALIWLGLMLALPLAVLFEHGLRDGVVRFWAEITNPIALGAVRLTIFAATVMTLINAVMGTLTAYTIVRYRFFGSRLLNSLIDLPFAIPTLVTGVMLVLLYGPQRTLGAWLEARGVQVIFAQPGIVLALLFITYPFVIRTVQPVLMEIDRAQEEAAWTLGASRWRTFSEVILPMITPSIITGALLSFARALGEFGSIVVVAGNIPHRTLTAPVYIFGQIESQNQLGASAVSILLLTISFALMLLVDRMQGKRGEGHVAG